MLAFALWTLISVWITWGPCRHADSGLVELAWVQDIALLASRLPAGVCALPHGPHAEQRGTPPLGGWVEVGGGNNTRWLRDWLPAGFWRGVQPETRRQRRVSLEVSVSTWRNLLQSCRGLWTLSLTPQLYQVAHGILFLQNFVTALPLLLQAWGGNCSEGYQLWHPAPF